MVKLIIKHLEALSVANGEVKTLKFTADENYIVKYIFIRRGDGSAFTKSTCTIWIKDKPLTRDKAPCAIFGSDVLNALELNIPLKKDWVFEYSGTNKEGTTISIMIDLVLIPQ